MSSWPSAWPRPSSARPPSKPQPRRHLPAPCKTPPPAHWPYLQLGLVGDPTPSNRPWWCSSVSTRAWIWTGPPSECFLKSFATGRCGRISTSIILNLIIQKICLDMHWGIVLRWMPWKLNNAKPTLVQVIARCRHGNKSLPEPMLTQSHVAIRCH